MREERCQTVGGGPLSGEASALVASYFSRWCLVILGFTETVLHLLDKLRELFWPRVTSALVASYFSRWCLVIQGFIETVAHVLD